MADCPSSPRSPTRSPPSRKTCSQKPPKRWKVRYQSLIYVHMTGLCLQYHDTLLYYLCQVEGFGFDVENFLCLGTETHFLASVLSRKYSPLAPPPLPTYTPTHHTLHTYTHTRSCCRAACSPQKDRGLGTLEQTPPDRSMCKHPP